jgi:PleD family two-component response regulator
MWAKCGFQPQVKSAPTQEKVAFSGFVNPMTGELIINECDKFNYKTIMESVEFFLKNIRKVKKKKVLIVLDNASWHKKAVRLIRDDSSFSDIEVTVHTPTY